MRNQVTEWKPQEYSSWIDPQTVANAKSFFNIGTTDSKQQALLKTTDVDTYTLDFEDDFELEKEQMIGALIYSIHKVEKTKITIISSKTYLTTSLKTNLLCQKIM